MWANLEPNKTLLVHEVVSDTAGRKQIRQRMRPRSWGRTQHRNVRAEHDQDTDIVENQMDVHLTRSANLNPRK
jgi:hypothetical protein